MDSSTGGFLTPQSSSELLFGEKLNQIIHDWIMGLTGLNGKVIMPRWQIVPPNLPNSFTTDWMTFGVTRKIRDGYSYISHQVDSSTGLIVESDQSTRWQSIFVLCSIYGPNQEFTEASISQGLYIQQNNEYLFQYYIRPIGTNETIIVPELIKNDWVTRWDLEIELSMQVTFNYSVNSILSALGTLNTDTGLIEQITT